MKNIFADIFVSLFVVVLAANMFVIISSMNLSKDVHAFDMQTKTLEQENMDLEKQTADGESFTFTNTFKEKWGFTKTAKSVAVGELQFALNTRP